MKDRIERACLTNEPYVNRTPLRPSPMLSRAIGGEVFLKLENLQRSGVTEKRHRTDQGDDRVRATLFPLALLAIVLLLTAADTRAQTAAAPVEKAGSAVESHHVVVAFPDADFYPHYTADPLRAQSALMFAAVCSSEIPESGDARFILRLGGRFPLLRVHPEGEPDRGLQLDFEGGFFGHFDIDHSLDNIGWDGSFGLLLNWKPNPDLGFRFGTLHDSAHLGDEYAERTGRTRIGYTRQEIVAGVSWTATKRWRVYAEGGWGFSLDEFQAPLRLQAGVELTGQRRFWNGKIGWYAASDLGTYEESDWIVRSTTQLGFTIPTGRGTQRYRLALEYGTGRSSLGEFTAYEESYLGLGWYFDF